MWLFYCQTGGYTTLFFFSFVKNKYEGINLETPKKDCQCKNFFFFFFFGHTAQHVGSQFPDKGLSLCPLHWKHGVLTTGPPGKSPQCKNFILKKKSFDRKEILLLFYKFEKSFILVVVQTQYCNRFWGLVLQDIFFF